MKNFLYLSFVYFISFTNCFAQSTVSGSQGIGTVVDMSDPVGIINGKDMPPSVLLNSPYLFNEFQSSTFGFRSKDLTYPVNIDMITNSLDIIYNGDTVFIELSKVDHIMSTFENDNVKIFTTLPAQNVEEFEGVYMELIKGRYSLYLNKYSKLNEPDFDPRFNVGSKDYSVSHMEQLLILKNGELVKVARKAKRNRNLFGSDLKVVRSLINENEFDYKNQNDVVQLIKMLNANN
jgi:hypothetical protein